ncbi:MAG: DUF4259 domain-containing protein [Candidatus Obscuribacterales bacterium]|nr:DUF4259 domain-containing protein [Candidatus Obscuribacterales bacterium]
MGAWDSDNFSNDDAADWLAELIDSDSLELLQGALVDVLEEAPGEYLEAPECASALAAAEIVAAANGKPADEMPEETLDWLKERGREIAERVELLEMARRAVGRIQENSELKDLWDEADTLDEWNKVQDNLRSRLN